jgi:hypothetical protein
MIITKKALEEFYRLLSTEALGEEFDSTPVGGSSEGDEETGESNEQFNESTFDDDSGGDEFDMGGDDFGTGDDFGGSGMDDMSGGGGEGEGLGTGLKPTDNPFKGQNGRALLDTKLAELYSSVDNSLKLAQANIKIDKVVVGELNSLLESIGQVREVVFIQPIETSLYRWSLCVKAYQLISKQLCINISKEKQNNSN